MSIFHCDIYTDEMRAVLSCAVSDLLLRKEFVGKQVCSYHIATNTPPRTGLKLCSQFSSEGTTQSRKLFLQNVAIFGND